MHDLAIAKLAFENCILKAEETCATLQAVNGLRAAPGPNLHPTPQAGEGGCSHSDANLMKYTPPFKHDEIQVRLTAACLFFPKKLG